MQFYCICLIILVSTLLYIVSQHYQKIGWFGRLLGLFLLACEGCQWLALAWRFDVEPGHSDTQSSEDATVWTTETVPAHQQNPRGIATARHSLPSPRLLAATWNKKGYFKGLPTPKNIYTLVIEEKKHVF